ncbi:MAG: 16S rRNA processing protein RimM [Micavibrio aeruginosavorus]|uniref:Ribosome maturation factor RimM n=1 Tax=Micavibrio aeruginosavorus TaxID=349221 RepID=A0A2W5FRU1_9BACT|nr:MAG: 16S rRNA processing protein RimM [Micavibrio aeruginosavorus]
MNANAMSKVCIAKIRTAHGVRGLVKVDCFLEDPSELASYNPLMTADDKPVTLILKNSAKGQFIAEIKGITDRNDAEKFRNIELFIDRDRLPETEDEFYHQDLIDLPVQNKDGIAIGKVLAVENFGASDLLHIQRIEGKSFYLPFMEPYVGEITEQFVTVDQIEEFLE